ncbi:MAG: hypothetical protein U0414_38870 [Polyangiaceae bacterium]
MIRFVLALAVVTLASRSARAEPATRPIGEAITLGPSTCLERKPVAEQIAMWLGRPDIDARLDITIEDASSGVRFTVKRDGVMLGERTLDVKRVPCEQIHAALGLGVAAAIDATVLTSLGIPHAPAEPPLKTPAPPTDVAPPPASLTPYTPTLGTDRGPVAYPPPTALPPPTPTPPGPRKAPIFSATLEGIVLIEVLPKVTLGVVPAAELTVVRGFDLRLSALATGQTTVDIGGGTADTGLIAGRLDACAVLYLKDDIGRLRGCAGVVAGGVTAEGFGFDHPQAVVSPWVAPSVRADVKWSIIPMFGLVVGVEGFFPGLKPELQVVDGEGVVSHVVDFPLAGVGISFGPTLTF